MGARGANSAEGRAGARKAPILDAGDEWRLVDEVRRLARESLPVDASVAVVALVHDELLDLDGRTTSRFPPVADPRERARLDWTQLVLQLESLRAQGAGYLIVPWSSIPWLGRRASFMQYLERRYGVVASEEGICAIYDLRADASSEYRVPDRLPLPPADLRRRGSSSQGARAFYESGALAADCIRTTLRQAGSEIGELDAVLDFGCGCGRVMRHWKWLTGPRLHGADTDADAIEWCARNLSFANVELISDWARLAHEDGSFDLVYALSLLDGLRESELLATMWELERVLRPGGFLLVGVRREASADFHERFAKRLELETNAPGGTEDGADDLLLLRRSGER